MGGRGLKSIGAVAGVLAVGTALGLTNAHARAQRTVRIASHISIRSERLDFSGRVTSTNRGCVPSRKVVLHRTNGDVLGSTHTDNSGHWSIHAEGSAGISMGHFYALAQREAQGTTGTIYICTRARSRTISYHAGTGLPQSHY